MSVIHTPRRPELDGRMIAFPVVFIAVLLVAFFRLWFYQVVLAPYLSVQANSIGQSTTAIAAPRGLIFDRNNHLLAGIQPKLVITGIPSIVEKNLWELDKLAAWLNTTPQRLLTKLKKGDWRKHFPTPLFIGADIATAGKIAELADDLPGIGVRSQPMRFETDPSDLSHILGYVWVPDQEDVKRLNAKNLSIPEYVGKTGVEWKYEADLMGNPGTETLEVDQKRRPIRVVGRDAPVPGKQLILSIDDTLQRIAHKDLKGKRGAVVAIDPSTGGILCMASEPTFDLTLFSDGISDKNYQQLNNDPDKPFVNRAVNSFYAPGSCFKIITSLAMYETGHWDLNRTVFCDGAFHIGKGTVRCLEQHGAISYNNAFAQSCNVYFCTMGTEAGSDAIHKAALEFGLGQKTGIDIRSELSPGFIPDAENVYKVRKDARWYGGDTANESIGQGFVQTSCLQMADVVAMVANRGVLYRPHIVKAIRDPETHQVTTIQPTVFKRIDAGEDFWGPLVQAMVSVIDTGTGQGVKIPGVEWAGKTGSAEHGKGKPTNGWFVGFAPAENPKIAIAVIIEDGGHGAVNAAPICKDIVEAYLGELKARSTAASASAKVASSLANSATPAVSPTAP